MARSSTNSLTLIFIYGTLACCLTLTIAMLSAYDWNISSLFYVGDTKYRPPNMPPIEKMGRKLVIIKDGAYDGEFYYSAALDPLNKKGYFVPPVHMRVLLPQLAYLLAWGNIDYIPYSYYALNLLGMLLSAVFFAKLCNISSYSNWLAAFFLLNMGILSAFQFNCVEPLGMAFFLWGLILDRKAQYWRSMILITLSILTRDTYIVLAFFLGINKIINKQFHQSLILSPCCIPYIALIFYFKMHCNYAPLAYNLIKLTSVYDNGFKQIVYSKGMLPFINSILFLPFFLYLIYLCYAIIKEIDLSNRYQFMCLAFTVLLGFFDPTVAWGHVTGIARHLTPIFTLIPLSLKNEARRKYLAYGSLVFTIMFFFWFFLRFKHPFIIINQ